MANPVLRIAKSIWLPIINLWWKLFHKITEDEIELIKSTHLFDKLDQREFEQLIDNTVLIRYVNNKIIFKEGSTGDAVYIVIDGSVRVFTYNTAKEKIALARLDKGSYFGEQAFIGHANKSRSSSIETITDTALLKIRGEFIVSAIEKDLLMKKGLAQSGKKQLFENIAKVIDAYDELESNLQGEYEHVVDYNKGDVIFAINDTADYVYIIIEGSVNIAFQKDGVPKNIKLTKGDVFGEVAVLTNFKRAGTATASEYTRLIRIDEGDFKKFYKSNPKLQKLLKLLNQSYHELPKRGHITQTIEKLDNVYAIKTNYKLNNGRQVVAVSAEDNFFIMQEEKKVGQVYSYKTNAEDYVEISLKDNYIVMVKCVGNWADLSNTCAYIIDKKPVSKELLDGFLKKGVFKPPEYERDQIICKCLLIGKNDIAKMIEKGYQSLALISEKTGACTVCGTCRSKVLDMLGQNLWQTAVMRKYKSHNDHVTSYHIEPSLGPFNNVVPGEHVVVQLNIEGQWVERPYTLSDLDDEGKHRITIKDENGVFTRWLFNNKVDHFSVYVSQPQGNFKLATDVNNPIICIAGGIGITPFIAFAKALMRTQPTRHMHLIYVAHHKSEYIFLDEFEEVKKNMMNFKLTLWDSSISHHLTDQVIQEFVAEFEGPEVYICGPEGFEASLLNSLNKINFRQDRIHLEKFTYANPLQDSSKY